MTDTSYTSTPVPAPAKKGWAASVLNVEFGAFVISVVITIAFIGVLSYAMIYGIKDNQTLSILTGTLVSSFTAVVQYWIGSSRSSQAKDATIATQAAAAASK